MSFLQTDVLNAHLDEIWGSGSPATLWVVLFVTLPDQDGNGGVEASWPAYAAVAVTNDATNWPAASGGVKENGTLIDYGVADGSASLLGVGFYDSATLRLPANFIACLDLTAAPRAITGGTPVSFPIGALDVSGCI